MGIKLSFRMIIPAGRDERGRLRFWGVWSGSASECAPLKFAFPGGDGHGIQDVVDQARRLMGLMTTSVDWDPVTDISSATPSPDGSGHVENIRFWLMRREISEMGFAPDGRGRLSGLLVASCDELSIMAERGLLSPGSAAGLPQLSAIASKEPEAERRFRKIDLPRFEQEVPHVVGS